MMRRSSLIIACLLTLGCVGFQRSIPETEDQLARGFLELLREQRYEEAFQLLDPAVGREPVHAMARMLGQGELVTTTLVGSQVFVTPDSTQAILTYELEYSSGLRPHQAGDQPRARQRLGDRRSRGTSRQRLQQSRPDRPLALRRVAMAEHRTIIVGGGFAGLNAALALRRAPVSITLIDRRNFHVFQPLLYQVATGGLSPADICSPLRAVVKRQRNARVLHAEVRGIDVAARRVELTGESIEYDTLIVAVGHAQDSSGHQHCQRRR